MKRLQSIYTLLLSSFLIGPLCLANDKQGINTGDFNDSTIFANIQANDINEPLALTANNYQPYQSFYIAPSLGFHHFDTEYNIDNAPALGLGLGYHFNENWALEMNAQQSNTRITENAFDHLKVSVQELSLDVLYHFDNFTENTGLYIPFGIGKQKFNVDGFDGFTETSYNTGLGIRYMPYEQVYLRSDVRALFGDEDDNVNAIVSVGLVYLFGEKTQPVKVSRQSPPVTLAVESVSIDNPSDYENPVLFDSAVSRVNIETQPAMQALGEALARNPSWRLRLSGHTDNIGSETDNNSLASARAEAVKQSVKSYATIEDVRIIASSYGESKPIQSNTTDAGRSANRRVEIEVISEVVITTQVAQ